MAEPEIDPELRKRLQAAGMIWSDKAQDWIPDPAIWEKGEADG